MHDEIEQKYEQNRIEQKKWKPYLCLHIYIIYVCHCTEEDTYEQLVYTPQR